MLLSDAEIEGFKDAAFTHALETDTMLPAAARTLDGAARLAARDAWWTLATLREPELLKAIGRDKPPTPGVADYDDEDGRWYRSFTVDQLRLAHHGYPAEEAEAILIERERVRVLLRYGHRVETRAVDETLEYAAYKLARAPFSSRGKVLSYMNRTPAGELVLRHVPEGATKAQFQAIAPIFLEMPEVTVPYVGVRPLGEELTYDERSEYLYYKVGGDSIEFKITKRQAMQQLSKEDRAIYLDYVRRAQPWMRGMHRTVDEYLNSGGE